MVLQLVFLITILMAENEFQYSDSSKTVYQINYLDINSKNWLNRAYIENFTSQ